MIAILAALALAPTFRVVELPNPTAQHTSVAIVVKLPELDRRELAIAQTIEANLLEGTQDFTKFNLLEMTSRTGAPIKCSLAPDHLRIEFALAGSSISTAGLVIDNIVRQAKFDPEKVQASLELLPFRSKPYWSEALDNRKPEFTKIKMSELLSFYRHVFRPENLTIGIAGPFVKGQAEEAIQNQLADWKPARDTYPKTHFTAFPDWELARKRAVTTIECTMPLGNEPLAKSLTIASVLGLGKGSILFRKVREEMRVSYRQEAFLWPSEKGLQLRLIVAYTGSEEPTALAEKIKTELLKAIDALDETDLMRAQNLFVSSWRTGMLPSPILLGADRLIYCTQEDQILVATYGAMKTGSPWLYDSIIDQVRATGILETKTTAKQLLESAQLRIMKRG